MPEESMTKSERRQKQKWCLSQIMEQSAASARRVFWIIKRNKIQALMLMITVMHIPENEKNRKILKAVRVSTALLWLLTCVEDLMLMIRKNYN